MKIFFTRLSNGFVITATILIFFAYHPVYEKEEIIIDSNMKTEDAIAGTKAPKKVIDSLEVLSVKYMSNDQKIHLGQIIINKAVKDDVFFLFDLMLNSGFVVEKVIPIVYYNWSDDKSMSDNNSSAFNYRNIAGTDRLSNHALGRAVDINPQWNPVIHKDGSLSPANGKYNPKHNGTFYNDHPVVIAMKKRGWRWGGDFSKYSDNHHFDKLN